MKANLYLGKYYKTEIEIHWSFFLMIVWILLSEILSGGSIDRMLFNLQFVVAIMICVLLHEIGHTMVARKFGIKTKKMVLLPIGGISTIDKTIESPKTEFLVAIGGPLVNVVIAVILYFAIPISDYISYDLGEYYTSLNDFTIPTFLFFLFIINVALAIFNLIPAFPLDGGRVLRAVLDLELDHVRATSAATTIGHIIGVILLLIGLLSDPILVFLSLFLFVGSFNENKTVHQLGLLKGHKVSDAMLEDITPFDPNDTMEDIIKVIITGYETNFIVVKNEKIVGLLYHKDIINNSSNKALLVQDLMVTSFKTVQADEALSIAYALMQTETYPFFPVLDKDKIVGAIDSTNLHEFLLMEAKIKY